MNPESLKPGDLCTWSTIRRPDVMLFLDFAESFKYSFLFNGRVETVSYDFVRTYLRLWK